MCDESSKRPPTLVEWAFFVAYSATTFAGGHCASPYISTMMNSLRFGNIPLASTTYQRPEHLRVQVAPSCGNLRVYLVDTGTHQQVEICKDMHPPTTAMAQSLGSRVTGAIQKYVPTKQRIDDVIDYLSGS